MMDWSPWDICSLSGADEERLRNWSKAKRLQVEQAKLDRNTAEARAKAAEEKLAAFQVACTCAGEHAAAERRALAAEAEAERLRQRVGTLERILDRVAPHLTQVLDAVRAELQELR